MFKFVDYFKRIVKILIGNLFSFLLALIAILLEGALIWTCISKENFSGVFCCVVSFVLGVVVWKFGAKFFPSVNKEKELNQRIKELQNENKRYSDELDMNRMVRQSLNAIQFNARLELVHVDTAGYLVKEEKIDDVKKIKKLEEVYSKVYNSVFQKFKEKLDYNVPDKIFYVKEKQHIQTFGIDLQNLDYAENNGTIYICGLSFTTLHSYNNLSVDEGVDFCVLENTNANRVEDKFITSSDYDDFKTKYKQYHDNLYVDEMNKRANFICGKFTDNMHKMLKSRYVNIQFVSLQDKKKYSKLQWKSFSSIESSSSKLIPIAYDIVTGLNMVRNV